MQKEQICYKFVITGLGQRETEKEWGDRDRMRENDLQSREKRRKKRERERKG